jgi:hypothetical protein
MKGTLMAEKKNTNKIISWPGYRICPRCHANDTKVERVDGNVRWCKCRRATCLAAKLFKEVGTYVDVPKEGEMAGGKK